MLIFVLLTTIFTAFTADDLKTANDLKQECASSDLVDQALCVSYLRGIHDGAMLAIAVAAAAVPQSIPAITAALQDYNRLMGCMADGVTNGQAILIFLKYVDNHPEQLHLPAAPIRESADSDPEIRTLSAPERNAGRHLPAIFLIPKGHDSGKKG